MEEALFFYLEAAMARTLPAHVPYNKEFCPFTLVGTVQYLVNSGKNSRYRHQPMPEGCLASLQPSWPPLPALALLLCSHAK